MEEEKKIGLWILRDTMLNIVWVAMFVVWMLCFGRGYNATGMSDVACTIIAVWHKWNESK